MTVRRRQQIDYGVAQARGALAAGRAEEAMRELDALSPQPDEVPEVVYFRVQVAMGLKRWAEASALLNDLILVMTDKRVVHLDRATYLIQLNRLDEARAALAPHPTIKDRPVRYTLLAHIAAVEGNNNEAVELLDQAKAAQVREEHLIAGLAVAAASAPSALADQNDPYQKYRQARYRN